VWWCRQVLIPLETGWFGAYANGSDSIVIPLEKQPFYQYDYIGLKYAHVSLHCTVDRF
jgi:hypothetical protein